MVDPVEARRGFLKQAVGAGSVLPLAAALTVYGPAVEAADPAQPADGYLSFGRDEAAFVEAMVNVMCPADDRTPDGVACGLAVFIDRQLAGDFGLGARLYRSGPWLPGKPQHGDQSPMTPEERFKAGIAAGDRACIARHGKPFDRLDPVAADAFLHDIAAGRVPDDRIAMAAWFDELVHPLFAQACFAHPIHGGNVGKVFWTMIGYPGLPATHAIHVVQYRGKPFPGASAPKSIVDFG